MNKLVELIMVPLENDLRLDFDYFNSVDETQAKFQNIIFEEFQKSKIKALFNLGFASKNDKMSISLRYIFLISKYFLRQLIQIPGLDDLKNKVIVNLELEKLEYFVRICPVIPNAHNVDNKWIKTIWSFINQGYCEVAEGIETSIQGHLLRKDKSLINAGKVCFNLVENRLNPKFFAFMTTFQSYDLERSKVKNTPLKKTLEEYNGNQEMLLKVLGPITAAAKKSSFINQLVEKGEIVYPISLSKEEAFTFLLEVPIYEQTGIICKVPNWWKKQYKTSINVMIGKKKSYLNFESLADFEVQMSLGNLKIGLDDLEKILQEEEGLVQYKGEWIQIDQQKLRELKEAFLKITNQLDNNSFTLFEALKLELGNIQKVATSNINIEVTQGEWVRSTLDKIALNQELDELTVGEDFMATLRPYQIIGVNWLNTMKRLRLGCCLADDMGLGKTIQVLGLLNHIKKFKEKTLLVVPASLVGNWISEIKRFTPNLLFFLLHPSFQKDFDPTNKDIITNNDLIITTYSMLSKLKQLEKITWDNIILDEAQAIKNPFTIQSKSARNLKAKYKLALTGTPIENRLLDLWTIFDFLNCGMLGSNKEFKEYSQLAFENDYYYGRLRQQIKPFILRRMKTDKEIISDLPDKIEIKAYANLSKKQLALYNDTLENLKENIENFDGIERRGIILQSIIKFKQICNHPSHFLGKSEYLESESGKFELLKDICSNVAALHESVIIFTQFKEITNPLDNYLASIFGKQGLILTGSTQIKKRKQLVDLFQSEVYIPYLIITIKAGGVGLNLTKANHVIHFDRWWNPAIENQATDRAFRIGQNKKVIVHKFITKNTVEEKIDEMIMDKVKLSDSLIGDNSEVAIMSMTNQEIINLFKLEREETYVL